jgi:hypothetical protein
MKVNDIVKEGVFDDLRAIGKASQAQNAQKIKQAFASFKGDITPQWYKALADKVGAEKANQQAGQLAAAWTQAWDKEFERIEAAAGKPFSDDEYRGLFRSWLEKAAKVNVDEYPLRTMIPVQSIEAVKQYFTNHFIPGYLKAQANPVFVIPNGTVVNTTTTVGRKTSRIQYTWDSSKGRFIDPRGAEVPTYTDLHSDLVQQAMDMASAASGGTMTIGGGGAATI